MPVLGVIRFVVVTANIGRKVGQRQARRNMLRVVRTFAGAIIGWQEIDEYDAADEHGILDAIGRRWRRTGRRLAKAARRGRWRLVGFGQYVPLSIPTPWVLGSSEVKPACPGRSREEARKRGTGATPHRVIVIARARHPELPRVPFSFLNGHLPYRVPDLHVVALHAWRDAIAEELEAGRVVVVTMDSNDHERELMLHPDQQQLSKPGSIDRLIVIVPQQLRRRGVEVDAVRRVSTNLTIDGHDADGVVLEVTVREEATAA